MSNDMHVGDMAMELAEHDFVVMDMSELLELAQKELDRQWMEVAQRAPDKVIAAYKSLIGEAV